MDALRIAGTGGYFAGTGTSGCVGVRWCVYWTMGVRVKRGGAGIEVCVRSGVPSPRQPRELPARATSSVHRSSCVRRACPANTAQPLALPWLSHSIHTAATAQLMHPLTGLDMECTLHLSLFLSFGLSVPAASLYLCYIIFFISLPVIFAASFHLCYFFISSNIILAASFHLCYIFIFFYRVSRHP